jgi:hypothetical protein
LLADCRPIVGLNQGTTLLGVVVKIANAKAMKFGIKALAADA